MRNNINKLSTYILANKHVMFVLLLLLMLMDKVNTFIRFSIVYTDSDQTLLWQVSKDLKNGIFHGPCFYGQSYNPIIEPLFSLPLLYLGIDYSTALPFITMLMGTFPFLLLSVYLYKRFDPLTATIPLIISLLLSIEFHMLSSIPRGFVTGIFFATIGITSITFHKTLIARLIGGLFLGIGVYANPNCLLLAPLLLPFTIFSTENFLKVATPIFLGFCISMTLIITNSWYYSLNPTMIIHNSPSLNTSVSSFIKVITRLDNYFDFVTPIFWRAGWIVFSLFIFVGIRTWRHGYKEHSLTILISFTTIVLTFFFSKVSDGTNSVFFSGARMYLAYPIIIIFVILYLIKTLNTAKKRIFYSFLILLSLISVSIKIVAFNPLLNNSLRGSAYTVVKVIKVKKLQNLCKELLNFHEHKPNLLLANSSNTKEQIITYGCECMIKDFPPTFQPNYERRTWLYPIIMDSVYSKILIYGNRPKNLSSIQLKKLNIYKSDSTKGWIFINNNRNTKDLFKTINLLN